MKYRLRIKQLRVKDSKNDPTASISTDFAEIPLRAKAMTIRHTVEEFFDIAWLEPEEE